MIKICLETWPRALNKQLFNFTKWQNLGFTGFKMQCGRNHKQRFLVALYTSGRLEMVNPIPHGGGADSALLQIVFFITSVRDAAELRNLVTFPKI